MFEFIKEKIKLHPDLPPIPEELEAFETRVAGISYMAKDVAKVRKKNPAYRQGAPDLIDAGLVGHRVYEYDLYDDKAILSLDPKNAYDPQAVKVVVGGRKIGYIKHVEGDLIRSWLKDDKIVRVDAQIKGGKYKLVLEGPDSESFRYLEDEVPTSCRLTIWHRK